MEWTDLITSIFLCGFLIEDRDVEPRTIKEAFEGGPSTDPDLKCLKTSLLAITSSFDWSDSDDEGFQKTEIVFSVNERLQIYWKLRWDTNYYYEFTPKKEEKAWGKTKGKENSTQTDAMISEITVLLTKYIPNFPEAGSMKVTACRNQFLLFTGKRKRHFQQIYPWILVIIKPLNKSRI